MMSATPGQIVNGGLIDFHDNFHRGMAEYANSVASHQQSLAAAGFPMQMQFAPQPQAQFQSYAPQPLSSPLQPPPCISGPPAYIHMHGQTYVPVDAQTSKSGAEPVQSAVQAPHVPLDDEEMERKVRERVEAYYANQKKAVYSAAGQSEPASRKALKGRGASDEDRAAERVHSVNAGMRGRFNSPF
jgi:hypothetical protein